MLDTVNTKTPDKYNYQVHLVQAKYFWCDCITSWNNQAKLPSVCLTRRMSEALSQLICYLAPIRTRKRGRVSS